MEQESMITIPLSQFNSLLESEMFLEALRSAGVDNWDGYDYAIDILEDMKKEES